MTHKITRLKLNNFKQYENFEWIIPKNNNANLIFGQNGSGKTTIIEAIEAISKIMIQFANIKSKRNIPSMANPFWIYDEYIKTGLKEDIEIEMDFISTENNEYRYSLLIGERDLIKKEELSLLNSKKEVKEIIFNKEIGFNENFVQINLINNSHGSLIGEYLKELVDDKPEHVMPLIELFHLNKYSKATEDNITFYELINSLKTSGRFIIHELSFDQKEQDKLFDFINEFKKFVKEIDYSIDDIIPSIVNNKNNIAEVTLTFKKKVDSGIIEVPLYKESNGTRRYLEYFIILDRLKDINDKGIILMDEFGISLNETLSIKLYEKILKENKYNKQLIFTTHNAIFLNKDLITQEHNKDWNKEKWILDKRPNGKVFIYNLAGFNVKKNSYTSFIKGFVGGVY